MFAINAVLLSTTSMYFFNKLLQLKAVSKERLYSSNSNFYNWKFGKIFYTVHGTGSPVLLIHDICCERSDYEWKLIINELSKEHTVYTIDMIGCGRSDKPKITYTNYLYVQLISDFIKNIIKHKTHIIATGLSASACIMSCYIEPQYFEKLTLVNPLPLQTLNRCPKYHDKLLKRIIETPILGTFIYNMRFTNTLIRKRFLHHYFSEVEAVSRHHVDVFAEASHLGGSSCRYLMSSIQANYININVSHALRSINNDIQIIVGADNEQGEQIKESYQELNASIETVTIPGTKLIPHMEKPAEFLESIYF